MIKYTNIILYILLSISYKVVSKDIKVKGKLVEVTTLKTLPYEYVSLLRGTDELRQIVLTDKMGYFVFYLSEADSVDSYYIELHNDLHQRILQKARLDTINILKAQKVKNPIKEHCSEPVWGNYVPDYIYEKEELPNQILDSALVQIQSKSGIVLLSQISFKEGIVVNPRRFRDLNKVSKVYSYIDSSQNYTLWAPSYYYLCFALTLPGGIPKHYTFQLELDSNGKILKSIEFPNVAVYETKIRIFSESEAKNKIYERGFDYNTTGEFYYDALRDSFIWFLRQKHIERSGKGLGMFMLQNI